MLVASKRPLAMLEQFYHVKWYVFRPGSQTDVSLADHTDILLLEESRKLGDHMLLASCSSRVRPMIHADVGLSAA